MSVISAKSSSVTSGNKYSDLLAGNTEVYPPAMVPLYSFVVPSGTTGTGTQSGVYSVNLTNIPQNYRALEIRYLFNTYDSNATPAQITFNGDSTASYRFGFVYGYNFSVTPPSGYSTSASYGYIQYSAAPYSRTVSAQNVYGIGVISLVNYTSTTKHKAAVFYSGASWGSDSQSNTQTGGFVWNNTSAVTSIKITTSAALIQNSKIFLYGIGPL